MTRPLSAFLASVRLQMSTGHALLALVLVGLLCSAPFASALGNATAKATVRVTVGAPTEVAVRVAPTSNVPVGPISFVVTNAGKLPHTFRICGTPTGALANTCAGTSVTLTVPHQSKTITLTLKKGTYEYLSTVSGQTVAGTKGLIGVGVKATTATQTIPNPTTSKGTGSGSGTGTGTATGTAGSTGKTGSSGSALPVFPTGNASRGLAVFTSAGCAACHTLAAAGAEGSSAPNLDILMPNISTVENQVYNGGGAMASFATQLTTQQIADVATFVSQSAHG